MEPERSKTAPWVTQAKIDVTGICSACCPFLGTPHDPKTPYAYADPSNRCFRHRQATYRQLQFQRMLCLSANYPTCPIYQEPEQTEINDRKEPAKQLKNARQRLAVPVIIGLFLVAALASWSFLDQSYPNWPLLNQPVDLVRVRVLFQEFLQTGDRPVFPSEKIESESDNATGPADGDGDAEAGPVETGLEVEDQPSTAEEGLDSRPIQYPPS